jgi:sortase A
MKSFGRYKSWLIFALFTVVIVITVIFSSSLFSRLFMHSKPHAKTAKIIPKENAGFPMRLKIPKIGVDAAVQYVGLTSSGVMDVPSNTVDVGWFKFGPYPGEKGSAVIAGHLDEGSGKSGVFTNLSKLKKGDEIYIDYANGTSIAFVVSKSNLYNPGYALDVFSATTSAHLNLITCDGVWDDNKKSYSKRLVVFADIAE